MPPTSQSAQQQTGSAPGEAIGIDLGTIVINTTNGKLELFEGAKIIAGLSSGNLRDMLTARKELELSFAKKSELTTDETSPDDANS